MTAPRKLLSQIRQLAAVAALLGLTAVAQAGAAQAAGAQPPGTELPRHTHWANGTALTTQAGQVQLGVLSESSYAYSSRVELRLHPLAFLVLPHAEVKLRWPALGDWELSSVHRISYPTVFLSLISRAGTGGLLPPTDDTPQAVLLDNSALASKEWKPGHWLTAKVGIMVATPGSDTGTVLDFPFLYPRLAALHAPWVSHATANATGAFNKHWGYDLEGTLYWLPFAEKRARQALEIQGNLHWRVNTHHQLSIGARRSRAQYEIGWRSHFLPQLDYRMVW